MKAGNPFILPLTNVGANRYMLQEMYNIIAIFGKIRHRNCISITIICSCPESVGALLSGKYHRIDTI